MMTKKEKDFSFSKLYRLIDANLNRLREGIRVLEDIQRFIYNNKLLAKKLKKLRHQCRVNDYESYLKQRDIIGDVLKETTTSESKRDNINSLILSSIKRSQESARVLEESFKLIDSNEAEKFKLIRYTLYDIEKEIF